MKGSSNHKTPSTSKLWFLNIKLKFYEIDNVLTKNITLPFVLYYRRGFVALMENGNSQAVSKDIKFLTCFRIYGLQKPIQKLSITEGWKENKIKES